MSHAVNNLFYVDLRDLLVSERQQLSIGVCPPDLDERVLQ